MVVYYEILGQKVGSHMLAIGILSTMFGGTYAMMGGSKKKAELGPPLNATSKDEENFITEFLKEADNGAGAKDAAKAKH
ncbi:hypothetical protein LTR36_004558 [Oleoguttula mirabilis]|uniref:Uncharacterized protein n=1 Tax=Oleoguttula mirabilis TaxID=1507867 RepID=A0AAV9JFH5_9PEZI|nr:hypothetical protein LTR36_004558 [Oleoguttula mirabilis]